MVSSHSVVELDGCERSGMLRALIRRMSMENPLWGAPRIRGELLKLGFEVAQSSVAKCMVKRRGGWRTFSRSRHCRQMLSCFNLLGQSQEARVTGMSRSPVRRGAFGPSLDFNWFKRPCRPVPGRLSPSPSYTYQAECRARRVRPCPASLV
jgi:hypothetical protein